MQRSRRPVPQRRVPRENSQLSRNNLLISILLFWGLVSITFVFSHGNAPHDEREVVLESNLPEDFQFPLNEELLSSGSDDDAYDLGDTELSMDDNIHETAFISSENIIIIENQTNPDSKEERETSKNKDRLSRIAPPGLDEFKSKTITAKGKQGTTQMGSVVHRVEPGGKEYNYASASKGAKVLDFNKEAKGAANILDKDKDKYLRNPCSVEDKFVVIELSEETLVDTIEIVNFEHYSSNLKDFELLSSLVYPTDMWTQMGNFTASNVKHAQRFAVQEPKWARYLKLNLLTHYGFEFYCTLSALEVYGVDAVERMLEDLISVQEEPKNDEILTIHSITRDDQDADSSSGSLNYDHGDADRDSLKGNGRMPGDTVLKILMQKVQHLVVNFSILERYLEELNARYGKILKDIDGEIGEGNALMEKIREELTIIREDKEKLAKDIYDLISWKSVTSLQLENLVKDNDVLRMEMESLKNHQAEMDNRGLAVLFICFLFGSLAVFRLVAEALLIIVRLGRFKKFSLVSHSWPVLLLSCTIIALVIVL